MSLKNYSPVDPKQFFHIHRSVCVHVCGFTSSWCWQLLVHLNWEQHESQAAFFHVIAIWGLCWCNSWDNKKTQREKRTKISTNHNEIVMKQEQDAGTRGDIWMGRQTKWEIDCEKQMMEDTPLGEQAKESDTKAEWWLKIHESGDRWIRRQMVREKWWEPSGSKEKTSEQPDTTSERHMKEDTERQTPGEPDTTTQNGDTTSQSGKHMKGNKWRETSGERNTASRRKPDWETSKERPVKRGIQRPGNH